MTRPIALITGASAGLGVHFATALAKRKQDVLLVARRGERIAALAGTLAHEHGIFADHIACDLAAPGAAEAVMREAASRGFAVDTLINNAGFGARGAFAALDGATQRRMIDLNCGALVDLCHAALPGMIAQRQGGILNIASTASFQPGPWMAVYYASKAFVLSFSEALHEEVKDQGIRVAALCPGPTRTEFAEVADMTDSELFKRLASDPEAVVRDGLCALDGNRAVKVSGLMNMVMAGSIRFTPRMLARRIAGGLQKRRGR